MRVEQEEQKTQITSSRTTLGTKGYIEGEYVGPWSPWDPNPTFGSDGPFVNLTSCVITSTYPDDTSVAFDVIRDCEINQTRSREIFDLYASGEKTLKFTQSEERDIEVTHTIIRGAIIYGEPFDCSGFTPDPSTIEVGVSFAQTQQCKQTGERTRLTTVQIGDSEPYLYRNWPQSHTENISITRDNVGTKAQD